MLFLLQVSLDFETFYFIFCVLSVRQFEAKIRWRKHTEITARFIVPLFRTQTMAKCNIVFDEETSSAD
jgi:hypothetical protein